MARDGDEGVLRVGVERYVFCWIEVRHSSGIVSRLNFKLRFEGRAAKAGNPTPYPPTPATPPGSFGKLVVRGGLQVRFCAKLFNFQEFNLQGRENKKVADCAEIDCAGLSHEFFPSVLNVA